MSGTARRDRLEADLSRFGALSPFATFETFAPGARLLLATAERNGELAVHVVRGLILVSRLEELNKTYGSVVVASAATIARVSEAERAGFEGPIDVTLRGREAGVAVHVLRRA